MLVYLLKRLLLILPTVWLICSLVFLLSRIVPGTYADFAAEGQEEVLGGSGKIKGRDHYLTELHRQGLDKPLFYFNITTLAQPDTLYRVFPEQHQLLLLTLLQRYGHWPSIAAYYGSLQALQKQTKLTSNAQARLLLPEKINAALAVRNTEELKALLAPLNLKDTPSYQPLVAQVQHRFREMESRAQRLNLFIPDFRWYGLNNQYHSWFTGLLSGNLGHSYRDQRPVVKVIKEAVGGTLLLLTVSMALTFWLSKELSLFLCQRQKGKGVVLNALYILDSTPLFLLALLIITLLLVSGLDASLIYSDSEDSLFLQPGIWNKVTTLLQQFWLPALCLILSGAPYLTTQLYRLLQVQLHSEFIKAARAKGLPEREVLRKHAFRNAMLPLITLFTGYLPAVISGAIVIEVIFTIPGSGILLRDSVYARDYPVIIGFVLFLAILKAATHILADALYFVADPRTRSHLA